MLSNQSPFYREHCVSCRLPVNACPCKNLSNNQLPFIVNICSHQNEWRRNDNTGQWALLSSPDIKRYRWHRSVEYIKPQLPSSLLSPHSFIDNEGHYLLYPSSNSQDIEAFSQIQIDRPDRFSPIKHLWVIDGTWQEAQKMFNQSQWLQQLPTIHIQHQSSRFSLRRNQQGLSTMESIEWAIRLYEPDNISSEGLKNNFTILQNALLKLKR